jgi:hypothetical protein
VPYDFGPCNVVLPRGGFPLSYVYDVPDISVPNQFGLEDDWLLWPSLINMTFYVGLMVATRALWRQRNRPIF